MAVVQGSGPHIERLEDDLQAARDRIKELEAALGMGDDILPLFRLGLTKSEARIVNLLCKRAYATREQALQAVYLDDPERRYDVMPRIIDVFVCKARKKLKRLGITICPSTDGRNGYQMSGPDKARLAKLIASGATVVVHKKRGRPRRATQPKDNLGRFLPADPAYQPPDWLRYDP